MTGNKLTLCLDFDGTIHSYEQGWQGGVVYGTVTPGFFTWAERMMPHFKLVIFSSRARHSESGVIIMRDWLKLQWQNYRLDQQRDASATTLGGSINTLLLGKLDDPHHLEFEFVHSKVPAWLTIDDRALQFAGDWSDPKFTAEALLAFKPWNAQPPVLPES